MIRGFIFGMTVVVFMWYVQWHSLSNQETSHYIKAGPLLADDYYPPDYDGSALPFTPAVEQYRHIDVNPGPVRLSVENLS